MKTDLIVLYMIGKNFKSGFDIMKELKKLTVKNTNIVFSSIYHMINKSIDKGWIKKTGSIINNGFPEKHIFEITLKGKKYLKGAIKKYFRNNEILFDADVTLTVLDNLDAELINERIGIVQDKLSAIGNNDSFYLNYLKHHLKAELEWLKSLL